MLLEFRVGNFLSFKEVQTLRLRRKDGNGKESGSDQIFIYGPNASGKSNFVKAMKFAADIVRNASTFDVVNFTIKDTFKETDEGDFKDVPIPDYSHLNMDNIPWVDEPSYFEFILRQDGKDYSLGFEMDFTKKTIVSEWLVCLSDDRTIFDNKYGEVVSSFTTQDSEYGEMILDTGMDHSREVPKQSVFFGSVTDESASKIVDWFFTSFIVVPSKDYEACIPVPNDFEEMMGRYLDHLDTGIDGVYAVPVLSMPKRYYGVTEEMQMVNELIAKSDSYIVFVNDIDGKLRMYKVTDMDPYEDEIGGPLNGISEVRFRHGKGSSFIAKESEGTIKIIQLLTLLISQFRGSRDTIVIDEMECSIHASLMNELVRMFSSDKIRGTQLIATTHETSIMDLDCLDENSFWFVGTKEQSGDRRSELYSLKSFTGKKDDFKTMYLDGRFEAIPSFMDLNLDNDPEE